jgi:hypothetical protein
MNWSNFYNAVAKSIVAALFFYFLLVFRTVIPDSALF